MNPNPQGQNLVGASPTPARLAATTPPPAHRPATPIHPTHHGFGATPGEFDAWRFGAQAFPSGFTRPKRSGRRIALGAGVATTVLIAGVGIAVAAGKRGADPGSNDPTPGLVSALTTSVKPPTTPKAAAAISNETPLVPGYQVVVAPDSDAAYDVPADWTVAAPDRSGGFGTPPHAVGGKGYATEGKDYCPGSTRTVSFLTGADDADSAAAAIQLGVLTAKAAYPDSHSSGTPGAPQPLQSLDGSQHGMFVETRGAIAGAKPGCATEYSIYTFATKAETGSFVMVIAADTGVAKSVDPDTARRIFASIRPHGS
ncbi:hypothetical protein [Nocardia sp. NPDC005366]|uniref:hypothetical protein n=1 Tax=Nocardia sp. NPDC005366 TaxID=3156878 RepID=UPI0033AAA651